MSFFLIFKIGGNGSSIHRTLIGGELRMTWGHNFDFGGRRACCWVIEWTYMGKKKRVWNWMRSLWMKGMLWMRRDWGGTEDETGDRTFRRDGAKGVVVVGKVLKDIICKITGNGSGHSWVLCCKQRSLNPLENIPFLLPLVLPGDGNPRVTPTQLRLVLGPCCVWPMCVWMMLQRKRFEILFHSVKGVEGPSTTFQEYNAGDKVKS